MTYTAAAFLLVMASAGCEQTDIYYEVDSNVTLNAENTYYAHIMQEILSYSILQATLTIWYSTAENRDMSTSTRIIMMSLWRMYCP